MFPTWAKNILFLLVLMISGLVLVLVIEGLVSGTELLPFNTVIQEIMANIRTPYLTNFFVLITDIGRPFILASLSVMVAIFLVIRKDFYGAVIMITAMLVTIISVTVLKDTFQITRPVTELVVTEGWSFPSGHAALASAFFFLVAHSFFRVMRTPRSKIALIIGSIIGALLISLSRLYLGAHFGLDVLGGVALGLMAVSSTVLVFNIIPDRWLTRAKFLSKGDYYQ
jgi:membrane-associated phospholipid phosphatase